MWQQLKLHFVAWHIDFIESILAGLSPIHGLEALTLSLFDSKHEQCSALVQVLQHG